jgi:hypothetical protein
MIVWGELPETNTGGRYDPATDSWRPTSTLNAPSARSSHTAVWTGSEMIVWGGSPTTHTGGRYCARSEVTPATICKEAILSPVALSGTAGGKAEIVFVQSDTQIHQQFSVRIEQALANNSYRVLVEISSGEPVDLGQQLDFGFVETDRNGNADVTWSSNPKNGERDIRPLLPPGNDVRNFAGVMVTHGGGTIIFLSGKFSLCQANLIPVESSSRPADSQARVLPSSSMATPR